MPKIAILLVQDDKWMTLADEKIAKEYICEYCNYKCFRKNDYEKHLSTAKHKKMEISKNMINLADENVANVAKVTNEEFIYILLKRT